MIVPATGGATGQADNELLSDLAALHDGHARYVLGYAHVLLGTRELAEEATLEVLLTGWRAGLAQEADRRAARLLLMSLVRREVAALHVRVPQLLLHTLRAVRR